ncbi:DUF3991 and toprim domain-containing protein [Ruminococcaceae bacterium OttesenSCG-928-A11]|nr:DUF3991 and toprim domain-containing protein [Ruminococcaceae bacterium OttesenSCG-928-A11]
MSKEQIERAKQIDLFTYLERFEPDELVPHGKCEYATKTHGSLVISHGKWIWNREGIGGRSALDYLVKVRRMGFVESVEHLCGLLPTFSLPAGGIRASPVAAAPLKKALILPPRNERTTKVEAYLRWRGIDEVIIWECFAAGTLYETKKAAGTACYYNCVFVGFDQEKAPRYAMQRGAFSVFRGEVAGSDKAFAFKYLPAGCTGEPDTAFVAESAIDILSAASLHKMEGSSLWESAEYLSLGGTVPTALLQYLADNPGVTRVCLGLDNDEAGRAATNSITRTLEAMGVIVSHIPPPGGKDYNQYLKSIKDRQKAKSISSMER